MADRRSRRDRYEVHLDYLRLHASKLQQVYERLVPDQARIAGEGSKMMESDNADSGNLCAGVVGQRREESTIGSQTAALIEFSRRTRLQCRPSGSSKMRYSGASLVRPGLEQLRDLAAEGQIGRVLVHAPDRLSRKYAYQVLLIEELGRHGVETIFLKAPQGGTGEHQLLVQLQGMIAEYERAQILERSAWPSAIAPAKVRSTFSAALHMAIVMFARATTRAPDMTSSMRSRDRPDGLSELCRCQHEYRRDHAPAQ